MARQGVAHTKDKGVNPMNIYQMYHNNKNKFGFYVRRDTWGDSVARIVGIEGVEEGEKISGRYPYYGNPTVYAEFYQISTKDKLDWNDGELSCPGNYSYHLCNEQGQPPNTVLECLVRTDSIDSITRRLEEVNVSVSQYLAMLIKNDIGIDVQADVE